MDLRPGDYVVTFTLLGFHTIRRDEFELLGTVAVTVNADLRVGAVEETITVTGEAPVVDVTTTRPRQTMDKDLIDAIPSARQYFKSRDLCPGDDQRHQGCRRECRPGSASDDCLRQLCLGQPDSP